MESLKKHGLEPKRMRTVHTKAADAPCLLLISATKGACGGLKIEPPLVVYNSDGKYTDETNQIYFG
jgi:tRNA1Val (adenine37-N6)-methyltransferase